MAAREGEGKGRKMEGGSHVRVGEEEKGREDDDDEEDEDENGGCVQRMRR